MSRSRLLALGGLVAVVASCTTSEGSAASSDAAVPAGAGQEAVKDDASQPDVVKVAVGSPDHTTLVTALKAANLVTSMSNAGPFTVFAPTNAAFDKLPAGTVDNLLKPENKSKLAAILQHHVMTSALDLSFFEEGQTLGMVDGNQETFHIRDGVAYIGEARILASVRASNGWVHVIDGVLVPKQ